MSGPNHSEMWARRLTAVVVAVALATVAGGKPPMDEDMAELAAIVRESCLAESGVELALINRVNDGADLMPDPALKCYIKCVMETAGMFADGVVDVETVLALLDDQTRAKNEAALRRCGTQTGADHCDTAYRTQLCWQTANKADYYLI